MKIYVIYDYENFRDYQEKWKKMWDHCILFTLFDWLFTWWESYGDDKELRIYVAEDENVPRLILPLMIVEEAGIRTLTQLGNLGSDFFQIIGTLDNHHALEEIFKTIINNEKYDRFYISNLGTDEKNIEQIIKIAFGRREL